MAAKKDKVLSLFQSKFKVTLYHKPTMNPGDEFYYIVLHSLVRVKLRFHIGNVLVIEEVVPLTMRYVKEFDEDFIKLLMENKSFTVLISCMGYTGTIGRLCKNKGLNIIEEPRLVTYPKPFYDRMVTSENAKVSQYGFYLLSVADDSFIQDVDNARGLDEVLGMIKKSYLLETNGDRFKIGNTLETKIIVDGDNVVFTQMDKISHPNPFMWYVKFTELLEELSRLGYQVYLKEVNDTSLYSVCTNKGYSLVNRGLEMDTIFGKIVGNSLGSFKVVLRG